MHYQSISSFELLSARGDAAAGPQTVQVAGNGASRIQFIAQPFIIEQPALQIHGQAASKAIHDTCVRVNGLVLLPALIVFDYENPGPYPNEQMKTAWMPSDRLDFQHGPLGQDHTVYNVTWPAGRDSPINSSPLLMVVRTFTTHVK